MSTKKYKFTSTSNFKVGDQVWISALDFSRSGKLTYSVYPRLTEIIKVSTDSIEIGGGYIDYRCPRVFYLDSPQSSWIDPTKSINKNIALTKEDAIENYNNRLKDGLSILKQFYNDQERNLINRFL